MLRNLLIVLTTAGAAAQTSIPDSGLTYVLADVAVIPDSGTGQNAPPRLPKLDTGAAVRRQGRNPIRVLKVRSKSDSLPSFCDGGDDE